MDELIAAMPTLLWPHTVCCRYRLVSPSASYASTFRSLQVKQELAVRCRAALLQEPTAAVELVQQRVLAAGVNTSKGDISSRGYELPELQAEAAFLAGQLTTLHAVRNMCHRTCGTSQPAVD